jgi:hypothetical protein
MSTLTEKNRAVYEARCEYDCLRRLAAEARRTVNRCKGEDEEAVKELSELEKRQVRLGVARCEYDCLRKLAIEAHLKVIRCKGEDKEATEKLIEEEKKQVPEALLEAEEADKKADAALHKLVIITDMTKNED